MTERDELMDHIDQTGEPTDHHAIPAPGARPKPEDAVDEPDPVPAEPPNPDAGDEGDRKDGD